MSERAEDETDHKTSHGGYMVICSACSNFQYMYTAMDLSGMAFQSYLCTDSGRGRIAVQLCFVTLVHPKIILLLRGPLNGTRISTTA